MPLLLRYWYHGASTFAPASDEIKYSDYQLNNHNRYDNTLVGCIQFKAFYSYSDIESRKLIAPIKYPKISLISPVEIKIETTNGGYFKTDLEEAKKHGPEAVADFIKQEIDRAIKNNSMEW